ncbi:MAG: CapA family protein [Leptospiraceae bacterium]|nr:CapA family protein [Leptospiraceae bacterium]MCK6380870.1 CapA family protein [Leptospiraceae bacterium]NUM41288.1 CapA family protein [Leptospiraceae bacterium]
MKILVGGDVMFNWGIQELKTRKGNNAPLIQLKEIFQEADFRAINLETPVIKKASSDESKSYVFYSKEEDLLSLKEIGVDLVFLGNNHSMDYGIKGLKETFEHLSKLNFLYAGAGKNLEEASTPITVKINEIPFQFISVSMVGESRLFAQKKRGGIAPWQKKFLQNKRKDTSTKIFSIHWGEEYRPAPYPSQVTLAHSLIDSGFKVVVGHHPHIPQAIEKYKDGIILYSLGNLIFGSRNPYLTHNIIAILHFENEKLTLCEIVPVFGKFQNEEEHIVRPLEEKKANEFLREISILSEKRNTNIEIKNGRGFIYFRKE